MTLSSTSSTSCPMLISMLTTDRQLGLDAAAWTAARGNGKSVCGRTIPTSMPRCFNVSMTVRHTRLMVP